MALAIFLTKAIPSFFPHEIGQSNDQESHMEARGTHDSIRFVRCSHDLRGILLLLAVILETMTGLPKMNKKQIARLLNACTAIVSR